MSRLEKAKEIIKKYFDIAEYGIYNTRNIVGDAMTTVYDDGNLCIDICYRYEYFEVFGLNSNEFEELKKFYTHLKTCGNEE